MRCLNGFGDYLGLDAFHVAENFKGNMDAEKSRRLLPTDAESGRAHALDRIRSQVSQPGRADALYQVGAKAVQPTAPISIFSDCAHNYFLPAIHARPDVMANPIAPPHTLIAAKKPTRLFSLSSKVLTRR